MALFILVKETPNTKKTALEILQSFERMRIEMVDLIIIENGCEEIAKDIVDELVETKGGITPKIKNMQEILDLVKEERPSGKTILIISRDYLEIAEILGKIYPKGVVSPLWITITT